MEVLLLAIIVQASKEAAKRACMGKYLAFNPENMQEAYRLEDLDYLLTSNVRKVQQYCMALDMCSLNRAAIVS